MTRGRHATCACGKLSVTCLDEPVKVSLCHCLACQRRTGSPFGIAAFFERNRVHLEGATKEFARDSDSGFPVTFHFCPDCGATVYWEPYRFPDLIAVAVGAFADPQFPVPGQAVYRQHRHGWVKDSG